MNTLPSFFAVFQSTTISEKICVKITLFYFQNYIASMTVKKLKDNNFKQEATKKIVRVLKRTRWPTATARHIL